MIQMHMRMDTRPMPELSLYTREWICQVHACLSARTGLGRARDAACVLSSECFVKRQVVCRLIFCTVHTVSGPCAIPFILCVGANEVSIVAPETQCCQKPCTVWALRSVPPLRL